MSSNNENPRTMALQQQTIRETLDLGKATKWRGYAVSHLQHYQQQQQQQQQQGRRCARCGAAFGRLYNTGASCPRCKHRVCRQCRELRNSASPDWLCSYCHKISDFRYVSAEWRSTTGRDNYLSAFDILKYSIRRAWTINGPPARWPTDRKSAEFRLYRSLPNRRRHYLDEENRKKIKKSPAETFYKHPRSTIKLSKQIDTKKSSIPIFRSKSSKEFEDIRNSHESPKRSLIPQRYRNSTDDLRRSREDINIPSFIPKLLSSRNKEDKLKRQDSKDDIQLLAVASKLQPQQQQQNMQEAKLMPVFKFFRRNNRAETACLDESNLNLGSVIAPLSRQSCSDKAPLRECSQAGQVNMYENEIKSLKMANESSFRVNGENYQNADLESANARDVTDEAPQASIVDDFSEPSETNVDNKSLGSTKEIVQDINYCIKEADKQRLSDSAVGKKIDEPVIKNKFSKEEFSNEDIDDTQNRRYSIYLSPEASPLSTRSSKYSPRESESEPTPALPRKTASEKGESSLASQRIRDAITRTRRESNSSAKYESSGSEGVRLSEPGLSNYVDIARRVKLFGRGGIVPSTSSCDEVFQRDSATSAGEDDHDEHSHDPTRIGPVSQNRVILRRRRQFDTQGQRRRGKSHVRSCCGPENLQALQVVGCSKLGPPGVGRGEEDPGGSGLFDYRRLVFISSDSSSGREEDDADSSCSGSSYLNGQPLANQQPGGLEDCDWDYFESNSLKLPSQLPSFSAHYAQAQLASLDWSCCLARPVSARASSFTCCQTCGSSKNAKVLPVPVPIPVPVPYPVPIPASLWATDFAGLERARAAATSSMISQETRLEPLLPLSLRGCEPSDTAWFSWNPSFDPSSLLCTQDNIFSKELSPLTETILHQEKQEEDIDIEFEKQENVECNQEVEKERTKQTNISAIENDSKKKEEEQQEKQEQDQKREKEQEQEKEQHQQQSVQQQSRMFRHSQEQNSRSSSGRSSADSSDLEDSASHRFTRVLIVNDDSLTSDNDIEDNEDSDSTRDDCNKIVYKGVDQEPVVLRHIRLLDEDIDLDSNKSDKSCQLEEDNDDDECNKTKNCYWINGQDHEREIAGYNEIYLAGIQEHSDNHVLLKSVKSIDPDSNLKGDLKPFLSREKSIDLQQEPEDNEEREEKEEEIADEDENENEDELSLENLSNDSAVMPDSLEVSIQELEDSIEIAGSFTYDIGRALLAASSPLDEKGSPGKGDKATAEKAVLQEKGQENCNPSSASPSLSESGGSSESSVSAAGCVINSSCKLHEYVVVTRSQQKYEEVNLSDSVALMAKSRKKWQIPASFDIKGMPCAHFMPPERRKNSSHSSLNPLLSATTDSDELQPEDEENANELGLGRLCDQKDECFAECMTKNVAAHDESSDGGGGNHSVRGERRLLKQVGGGTEDPRYRVVEWRTPTPREESSDKDDTLMPPAPVCRRDWIASNINFGLEHFNYENNNSNVNSNHNNKSYNKNNNNNEEKEEVVEEEREEGEEEEEEVEVEKDDNDSSSSGINSNAINQVNKYKSLVMITQGAYQPVNVITSDTTTLLQPQFEQTGYFQMALESGQEVIRRNVSLGFIKKPLPCKRLFSNPETEVDSGLSVGSASESDDVQSVKNTCKHTMKNSGHLPTRDEELTISSLSSSISHDCGLYEIPKRAGPLILEEGLADDDSWVEEISHDEDEQSATTATEESSEDEAANNLGDREEELRGYHRQAIDFTLHTIVEESCEESEGEHTNASWRRRLASASASELDKYLFFGIGVDATANSLREVDSLSESSSIFSEGLDSLTREDPTQIVSHEKCNADFPPGSLRLEKYFLGEFLGLEQDRRDSDGSVGSDSEGRPSPEAQRRKRLVRARGTGRSHSSSLDNLLALAHNSQNTLQDASPTVEGQESQSEGSSTETDGIEDNPTPAFGTDGQFDTVKRKKKKPRNPGAQSPRVSEDRNKTPEPRDALDEDPDANANSEEEGTKTPQPEIESNQGLQDDVSATKSKQQSRDSGFVGSCDDLLLQPPRHSANDVQTVINGLTTVGDQPSGQDHQNRQKESNVQGRIFDSQRLRDRLSKMDVQLEPAAPNASLSRKDSFNNWSSDEETNLMMSKMRQFFKTMVANSNGSSQTCGTTSSTASAAPTPSPRLSGYSKMRGYMQAQNRTKPPQLVYFENELTRLMKTVPGIRDEQVREIVEYLSSEDTWSDSYDSSDYTSSDLEGATAGGKRSAIQEQISQSCQQIINKFDTNGTVGRNESRGSGECRETPARSVSQQSCLGRDTAFVYQKLVQSFTKMAGDNVASDTSSTPHSSPPLIAKVMHHIGSRLVALMHEVSESNSTAGQYSHSNCSWRRYPHNRTPSSASTTEDDDSTSDSASAPTYLPRSKSHDPLLLINGHAGATSMPPESEEREASDYERFSWRGSFESALMAADSRTKLSLLACSGDVGTSTMAAKRRSAGDLLFNPKSFSREQLDRVRSCGSIGGNVSTGTGVICGGSIEEKIWSNRRRSSVPDANTRGESGASAGDEDTEDDENDEGLEYGIQGDSRATTLPRGMQMAGGVAAASATNSLPRQSGSSVSMHKAHSVYHFLPQHNVVKSARYRPPGFTRNSSAALGGPKRALSAPGLQLQARSRRQQSIAHASGTTNISCSVPTSADEVSSLSEACSTPIIGASSRIGSSHTNIDMEDIERSLHTTHLVTRSSLSSLGARSDSMASVYSGAGEGRWCGSVAVKGEVEFSLQYDYKQLTFEVHVTQCKDLAPVDVKRNRSDPYVKVYLLPDKSKSGKRKTKVKKHTLNPIFDETLKFHTSINSLESRTLWLTVWHSDMFGRNDFLGEVRMPLENKIFDDPRPQWYSLQERTEPFDDPVAYKGEVIVGLKFVPPDPTRQDRERDVSEQRSNKLKKSWSKGSLHVLVKEARNLQTRAKNSGTCDPFCKSYLLPDKGRSGKQKTGVVRRSVGSPVWNHTFIYKDVSLQELADRGLELTVWDHDRIASNEFLGGVRFNLGSGKYYGKAVDWMDATGREMSLWQNMLERPNFWVEGAVTLRPNLHNHGKTGTS
ncbi:PREDICTED: uncharacterized protein LOC105366490 [Ceratosolen solmsi marchali]|uniref:Uncharacterized protein LOC105366490 n=1 Tax=Ceratosolen solmsi marchali TaxID=326594 RepID=A0AAJ7E0K5_9HYME|nr:PREDICTED: uncharacterized protein LOC105366490 [Ceratosolen solmsi marchali]